jgi:hypothetical protein
MKVLSGSSVACPVIAGMVSLVNAKRKEVGKSLLGWINPALYKYSSSFVNDVTIGENRCTAYATVCCQSGFAF